MSQVKEPEKYLSGSVQINDPVITWSFNEKQLLQLDLSTIVVIGEYTTANGPWQDDWFIVFVDKTGSMCQIPMFVSGWQEMVKYLESKFMCTLSSLVGSTEWASVVDHPHELKGKTLLQLQPAANYKPRRNFFQRLLHGLGIGGFNTEQEVILTDEVKTFLDSLE